MAIKARQTDCDYISYASNNKDNKCGIEMKVHNKNTGSPKSFQY
jgi:hypothetical protein